MSEALPLEEHPPKRADWRNGARMVAIGLALALSAVLAAAELVLSWPVPGWLYAGAALLFGLALVRIEPIRRQRLQLAVLAVAVIALALLHWVPWTSRKPFLQDLGRVHPGMTESEVRSVMAEWKVGTGWPANPFRSPATGGAGEMRIPDSLVFRHSDDGEFNSDWGVVEFVDGRVSKVSFSAD